ncbi:MAG: serine hydrolase [Candidatus Aminicenantes bacterium]|nr:serine hydrolase [Candidatus Aminicenantes bacterium]NIM84956.1 serine hydrolase [Candidatus Aminicenantes bacterium]NIN24470.1 serine hydrolase [Candidatus Aminicenantes bacterium]NIN48234.1 serine hydrolase [Candidatus Aminicenantes bacterium]NIN91137.1 serine hydrolase [Candidatus Aminicenantes bacterium]
MSKKQLMSNRKVITRSLVFLTFFIVSIVAYSAQETKTGAAHKIRRIENSLKEFRGPMALFQAKRTGTQKKMVLSDRMAHYRVPGISIAVIDNYKVDWAKGYGIIKAGSNKPVTPKTCFEAASTTKLLCAVMALCLVEQGRLDLDKDINKQLKSWKIPGNNFTGEQKVTLQRLLTHRSGLNRPDGGIDFEEGSIPTLIQVLNGESPAKNKPAAVEYVPGSQFQYSNMGFLVIQLLLQDVTGKPFAQLARETVFEPLGMKASTLMHPLKAHFKGNVIAPHDREGKAHERPQHPTALAQGGLVTTPTDLALFTIELMRGYRGRSQRLLSAKTLQKMLSVQFNHDPRKLFGITSQGLGVFLVGEGQTMYFLHPGQNNPGATCMLIASPATGKGAVIMTNGEQGMLLSFEILAAIMHEYGWPVVRYGEGE